MAAAGADLTGASSPRRRDRGAVLPIVALALPVLILMTSFAVDLGRQRALRRDLQANADVIALDLSRELSNQAVEPDAVTTLDATNASLLRNELDPVTATDGSQGVLVEWGSWTQSNPCPTPILGQPPSCFTAGGMPLNAVRVTLDDELDYFFQTGSGSATRSAVATRAPRTWIQVGSVAAGLQTALPGPSASLTATVAALNARLGASFGASVPSPGSAGLDAVSYEGLASTDVDLWDIAQAGGFASPNELLDEQLTVGQLLDLTATALDQQAAEGDPNAAGAAASIRELGSEIDTAVGLDSTNRLRLGDTISADQGGEDSAASSEMNVLDLLSAGADVIDAKHFLSYSFVPGIPGVASANIQQYVVSPATIKRNAPVGDSAVNKQSAFQITLDVAPLLGMTGPAIVPIFVDAASATATVDEIRCTAPDAPNEVDLMVDTSVLSVRLGSANNISAGNLNVSAGIVAKSDFLTLTALAQLGLNVLSLGSDLKAQAAAGIGGANGQGPFTFQPDIDPNPAQRAQGGVGATSIGAQLKSTLQAQNGLGLLTSTVSANLGNQLDYVFQQLDALVVQPLLAASGLAIGGADVRAFNLRCGSPMLIE